MIKVLSSKSLISLIVLSLCVACGSKKFTAPPLKERNMLAEPVNEFPLGRHSFSISTKSADAQQAFDRGFTLAYAFSHAVAEREFRRAAELDPEAAMPWWGVALVNGPHINYPLVPEEKAKVAWEALTKAKALAPRAAPMERDLITALSSRYSANPLADRGKLDTAYVKAMSKVAKKYSYNADVMTLYAEAMMDLHPWDFWFLNGKPKPWTPLVVNTLEQALTLNSQHPGANHLYIHTMEASSTPDRAVLPADILRTLVPAAGHLVHMPAHIYIRVGRWDDAADSNENAVKADQEFSKTNPRPGFYAAYMAHNNHFLSFVRMMQGQREKALAAARAMIAGVPEDFLQEFGPIADGYMAIAIEVLMRFGNWEDILAEPEPAERFPFTRAIWRFARTSALNALGRREDALKERELFLAAVPKVPKEATFGNNKCHTLLAIALDVIDGELAAKEKQYDAAIKSLRAALETEDSLTYDEPPDWILPVRHTLGAVLVSAGKGKEAEEVYRQDLKKFPRNGWSLAGMNQALKLQGRTDEAQLVKQQHQIVWADADYQIESSCACEGRPKAGPQPKVAQTPAPTASPSPGVPQMLPEYKEPSI